MRTGEEQKTDPAWRRTAPRRRAFTLVEMLVVISIIGILASILMPAINSARNSARSAQCQNNLRQLGLGLLDHCQRSRDSAYCSGAFDWGRDGPVTEVGWVADLVRAEIPVGELLCPSNLAQVSEAYEALLSLNTGSASFGTCVDGRGSAPRLAPDGTPIINPCRQIIDNSLAPDSEPRRVLVEKSIFAKGYNTNYTASWFLVRSGVVLGPDGNPRLASAGCGTSLKSRNTTKGPLTATTVGRAKTPASHIPLLGDGAVVGTLPMAVGRNGSGEPTVQAFTNGPILIATMQPPTIPSGTPYQGANGWWAIWNRQVLQDYRGFAPLHAGVCNILFADGSVRAVSDENGDDLLNNGFAPAAGGGFADDKVEMPTNEVASLYALDAPLPP